MKNILLFVSIAFALFSIGFSLYLLIRLTRTTKNEKQIAENKREEKRNELEKKSADDIAADSPDPDAISSNIEREQQELRERVRNRLNKNIQRNRSSTDN